MTELEKLKNSFDIEMEKLENHPVGRWGKELSNFIDQAYSLALQEVRERLPAEIVNGAEIYSVEEYELLRKNLTPVEVLKTLANHQIGFNNCLNQVINILNELETNK